VTEAKCTNVAFGDGSDCSKRLSVLDPKWLDDGDAFTFTASQLLWYASLTAVNATNEEDGTVALSASSRPSTEEYVAAVDEFCFKVFDSNPPYACHAAPKASTAATVLLALVVAGLLTPAVLLAIAFCLVSRSRGGTKRLVESPAFIQLAEAQLKRFSMTLAEQTLVVAAPRKDRANDVRLHPGIL